MEKNIIVRLKGGLGNQMFQYALGRRVAIDTRRTLQLDVTHLLRTPTRSPLREYCLDFFAIEGRVGVAGSASDQQRTPVCHIVDHSCAFHPEVVSPLPFATVVFDGYWQSDKYFTNIEAIIRKDLSPRIAFQCPGWITAIAERSELVCIHVRRQDYLTSGQFLGFVGEQYYKDAIELVMNVIQRPFFLVFSDDLVWCRHHLSFPTDYAFVEPADTFHSDAAALYLMSRGHHFVIANSTFSWWGAWLGTHPEKVVVAPAGWFHSERHPSGEDSKRQLTSKDLIPVDWQRI